MKILGINVSIGRATETAEPQTKRSKTTIEIGDSGTQMLSGVISDDYNTRLLDTRGIAIYDEMRKSDGTVRAAVSACILPILGAHWYVKPASQDQADIDIADFVSSALFDEMSITWNDFLRQALLSLPFGVMVFEKVFDVRDVDGQTRVIWKKLAPRMPKSIYKWQTENGEDGIQQRRQDGKTVSIPIEKLLVFVNEREGDNMWGTSILRAAYKHWYFKNTFYKIDAIAFERQGLGVPSATLPDNYTEADRSKAEELLKNLRANEHAFIVRPKEWEIEFMDMKAGTLRDPSTSIGHHNREIVKSVLAQFLELGASEGSGSYSTSQDHSDLFLRSLEAQAQTIADVINKYGIPQLVDLNFDVSKYPEIVFSDIKRTDVKNVAEAYNTLITAGGIVSSDQDEKYFRELLGLPERDPNETPDDSETPEEEPVDEEDMNDELGLSEYAGNIKKKIYPERSEVAVKIRASIAELPLGNAMAKLKGNLALLESRHSENHKPFYSIVKSEVTATLAALRRTAFAEQNDFKGRRALTFAEKKVDFGSLQKAMDKFEDQFDTVTRELLHAERERFMKSLTKAVLSGDTQAIKDAAIKAQGAYAKIIKQSMKDAFEYGKTNAAREMGVKTPANPSEILQQIDIQADAIATMHVSEIENRAKTAYVNAKNKGESSASALASADAATKSLIDELTQDTSRIITSGYINHGRNTVFENNGDKIYALQRSEILDSRTCNFCLSVDGRIVEKNDPFGKNTIFHSGCRGIWVEILLDEEELPPIGGIPKSIRDRFGDAVNDLIQPRVPQTRKDSIARKEAERRAKRNKN